MGRAVVLSGSIGLGHDVLADAVCSGLAELGWATRTVDAMALLGPRAGRGGELVFRALLRAPAVYDAVHFAHLRTGSPLAATMDRLAAARLVPALRAQLLAQPAGLIVSVFPTGASAAGRLRLGGAAGVPASVVLCPDATAHALWVRPGTDLYLVASRAAAASVRRFDSDTPLAVVPVPVRRAFFEAPPRPAARAALGLAGDRRTALVIGGGWGLGPIAATAGRLAADGWEVLAVAGRNRRLLAQLEATAAREPRVHPFGYTEAVPDLMAAADVVVTAPGALTCAEARVVGRRLVVADVVAGHGRDNVQHQVEHGALVSNPAPADVARVAAAALALPQPPPAGGAQDFPAALAAALSAAGLPGV